MFSIDVFVVHFPLVEHEYIKTLLENILFPTFKLENDQIRKYMVLCQGRKEKKKTIN